MMEHELRFNMELRFDTDALYPTKLNKISSTIKNSSSFQNIFFNNSLKILQKFSKNLQKKVTYLVIYDLATFNFFYQLFINLSYSLFCSSIKHQCMYVLFTVSFSLSHASIFHTRLVIERTKPKLYIHYHYSAVPTVPTPPDNTVLCLITLCIEPDY